MEEKTILLVEDNPDDEELTILALKANKIFNGVVVTRDGVEALDYLFGTGKFAGRNTDHLPQFILLDLKLPRVNGLEVLQRLRSDPLTKFVPVVVLTSSSEEDDILSSYRLGANSYVRKPIEYHRFVDSVRQLGLYWLLVNENPPQPAQKFGH